MKRENFLSRQHRKSDGASDSAQLPSETDAPVRTGRPARQSLLTAEGPAQWITTELSSSAR